MRHKLTANKLPDPDQLFDPGMNGDELDGLYVNGFSSLVEEFLR